MLWRLYSENKKVGTIEKVKNSFMKSNSKCPFPTVSYIIYGVFIWKMTRLKSLKTSNLKLFLAKCEALRCVNLHKLPKNEIKIVKIAFQNTKEAYHCKSIVRTESCSYWKPLFWNQVLYKNFFYKREMYWSQHGPNHSST